MIDVSDIIEVKKGKFLLTEDVAAGKNVTFRTKFRGQQMYFEGYVTDDKRRVCIMAIGSV